MSKEEKALELFKLWRSSPIRFIQDMWGLTPQIGEFEKGKHITWQQHEILLGVERAIQNQAPKRISVSSGHGTGKDAILAWLGIWFLFCHKDAQVPCTAPTSPQLFDVLWKEYAKWISAMPEWAKKKFDWTATHVRFNERPETWFASARTAKKEAPEALAGFHGEHLLFEIDEASGIPEEIFQKAEGSLTNKNAFIIMVSNPTRNIGYFYDSHHKDKENWQTYMYNSLESPIVDKSFVERIAAQYGEDSDEYGYMVKGSFPREDQMDKKGYMPLFLKTDIKYITDERGLVNANMGVDPAGEGRNETIWVVRDNFKAKIVAREPISNPKGIAQKTLTLMDYYGVAGERVTIDNFGIGANVSQELALSGIGVRVNAHNVGEKSSEERFINRRAEYYWNLKEWLRSGGELVRDPGWEQLLSIRYRRTLEGKIQIMPKREMVKEGYPSPDCPDALSLTFAGDFTEAKEHYISDSEIMEITGIYK